MSSSSRTTPSPEAQVRSPDIDTQPVEPPPSPPGKDEDPPPPNKHGSVGGFDELTSTGVARGWALDPDLPNGAIFVYFYVDAPMSLDSYAGQTRAWLPGTPGSQGANHAFSWRIPEPAPGRNYRDGLPHTLYAYAIDCSGLKVDSPLLGQRSFVLQPGNEPPVGSLGLIESSGNVTGWAVDPNTGAQALTVSLYVAESGSNQDGVLAGQVLASLSRPDVNHATGCPGGHGFEWSIPAMFRDGLGRELRAYVNDSSTQSRVLLSGSPRFFALTQAAEM